MRAFGLDASGAVPYYDPREDDDEEEGEDDAPTRTPEMIDALLDSIPDILFRGWRQFGHRTRQVARHHLHDPSVPIAHLAKLYGVEYSVAWRACARMRRDLEATLRIRSTGASAESVYAAVLAGGGTEEEAVVARAYFITHSTVATAKMLGIPQPTVWDRLDRAMHKRLAVGSPERIALAEAKFRHQKKGVKP